MFRSQCILPILIFSLCLALCAAAYQPCRAYQVMNLAYNGSFEISTAGINAPSGWRYSSQSPTDKRVWGFSPCAGDKDYCLQHGRDASDAVIDNGGHMIPVAAGSLYKFRFLLKGSADAKVTIAFCGVGSDAHAEFSKTFSVSAREWTPCEMAETAPMGGPSLCRIDFRTTGAPAWLDIDNVEMFLDPGPPAFPDAYCNLTAAGADNSNLALLTPSRHSLGAENRVVLDKECASSRSAATHRYLSFRLDRKWLAEASSPRKVAITIEYADKGSGQIALEYDAIGSSSRPAGVIRRTDTGEWIKKTFYISDAKLAHRGPGGADIRIDDCDSGPAFVSYVALAHWDSTQGPQATIVNNHLEAGGLPAFLLIAAVNADFYNPPVMPDVPRQVLSKEYTAFLGDLYWGYGDKSGDGSYYPTGHFHDFFETLYKQGTRVGLKFETEQIGCGYVPKYMFSLFPVGSQYQFQAMNSLGQPVIDTSYQTNEIVQSYSSEAYLNLGRAWMNFTMQKVDRPHITWWETPVEPQFQPDQATDYGRCAVEKWHNWLAWRYSLAVLNKKWGTNYRCYDDIAMPLPDMPLGHPMTSKDPKWRIWQAWRASVMAGWIEGDIQTIRNSVGEQALVAVDVLDVNDSDYRLAADSDRSLAGGPSRIFRTINPNIYKVNWTWLLGTCESWDRGYNLCVPIAAANNRAISEHMTLNNADFSPEDVDPILKNTLAKGNRFGWWLCAWANVGNNVGYLYNNDWSPKPVIKVLDDHRDDYLRLARASLTKPLPDLPAPAQTQLAPNHSMGIGWTCSLVSKNGDFSANMQHDGNLVISTSGLHPVWATGTNGHAGAFATMQPTGELVVLSADGKTLWTTGTAGHPGAHASVLDSGKLVIVSPTGEVLWTGGK